MPCGVRVTVGGEWSFVLCRASGAMAEKRLWGELSWCFGVRRKDEDGGRARDSRVSREEVGVRRMTVEALEGALNPAMSGIVDRRGWRDARPDVLQRDAEASVRRDLV